MTASVWNSGDLSGVTLSNNSLTANSPSAGGVRATQGQTSGKYYFEITCNAQATGNFSVGVANASAALASVAATPTNAALVYPSGNLYVNNVNQGNMFGTLPYTGGFAGYTVAVAIDFGAKLIWIRYCAIGSAPAGNWNNSGTANPATGAGGISISSIAGSAIFPTFASSGGDTVTANFGVTPFIGTTPSGFTAGWPTSTAQTANYTTWNGSDQSGTTLLAGSLEATWPITAGGVRSVKSNTTGKYYFEAARAEWSNSGTCVGIANSSAILTTVGATPTNAAIINNTGGIYVNNVSQGSLGVPAKGAVIGIAYDLVNNAVWFRIAPSGNWNNSGTANPATNTGGFSISAIAGRSIYALAATNGGLGGDSVVANFGDQPFVGAPPLGFNIATVAQNRVMVMA